ncbi:hypothetical protein VNO80_20633 [Phaseolus coccineus]|uniref:Uncharacterized protein n=1 Tax=Phaseolus coccineus TaxID=3886 RepID=A0AAN9M6F0_PHACN
MYENGFYENLPCHQHVINEGLAKNVVANYEGAANAEEDWAVDECYYTGVNEDACSARDAGRTRVELWFGGQWYCTFEGYSGEGEASEVNHSLCLASRKVTVLDEGKAVFLI